MDSGGLVPDQLIIDMMIGAMKKAPKGYVLDGFPRTIVQAQGLDNALAQAGEKLNAIVNLEVADEEISSRMTGRRSCPKCGAVYHIANLKPKIEGQCDKGCGRLLQREDDKQDVVANRLKTYHEQTAAVVGFYSKKGEEILSIDAVRPIEQVTTEVFRKLDRLKKR
jgi:adenylate kinase